MTRKNSIKARKATTKPKPGSARTLKKRIPVSYAQAEGGNKPRFVPASQPNCLRLKHREYLGPAVAGSSAPSPLFGNGVPTAFAVTPTNGDLFNFIVELASRFEKWRGHFRFIFRTTAPTGTGGAIYMALDPDPNDGLSSTIETMLMHSRTATGPLYRDLTIEFGDREWRWTSVSSKSSSALVGALGLTDLGNLQLAIRAGANYGAAGLVADQIVGDVFCEYDIELMEPTNSLNLLNPLGDSGRITEVLLEDVTDENGAGTSSTITRNTWKSVNPIADALNTDIADFIVDTVYEGWVNLRANITSMHLAGQQAYFNVDPVVDTDEVVVELSSTGGRMSVNYAAPEFSTEASGLYHVSGAISEACKAIKTITTGIEATKGAASLISSFFPSASMGYAAVAAAAADDLRISTKGLGVFIACSPASLERYVRAMKARTSLGKLRLCAMHINGDGVRAYHFNDSRVATLHEKSTNGPYWAVSSMTPDQQGR
jgi:hypothetical protein